MLLNQIIPVKTPLIGGPMYPCSNPELIAAISNAGGLGIIQPMTLEFVFNYPLAEGIDYIRTLTDQPIGLNLILETSSKKYIKRTEKWLQIAIEKEIPFLITALGDPTWVVEKVKTNNIIVFHDVINKRHAAKASNAGVNGLICVNNLAGGHTGQKSPAELFKELGEFDKPKICAGGVSDSTTFTEMLEIGYAGCQLGTRFIASTECSAHNDYKQSIVQATVNDIVLSEKITGIPVSVINTDYIKKQGVKATGLSKWLLNNHFAKHWVRTVYSVISVFKLKKSLKKGGLYKKFFQAGKSVHAIDSVSSVQEIIDNITSNTES